MDDFVRALALLATVGGAYWGAVALDALIAFWILLGIAVLFALTRSALPPIIEKYRNLRKLLRDGSEHPRVMRVAAEHQAEVEDLRRQLEEAQTSLDITWAEGILEGRRRVIGEILALTGAELSGMAISVQNNALVCAAWVADGRPMPEMGSLWCLRVRGVGQIKARVRVVDLPQPQRVILALDYSNDPVYTEALKAKAATASDFPSSLEIVPRDFTALRDLEDEAL